MSTSRAGSVQRLGPEDLTVLAADSGGAPMQIAAALEFDRARLPSIGEVNAVLADRVHRIPRLSQRLVVPRLGGGRPYWTEDPDFRLDRQLVTIRGVAADSAVVRERAAELLCRPLERDRPLWRAALISDDANRGGAGLVSSLVIVLHHVLADGVSGLAALSALTDAGAAPEQPPSFPGRPPEPVLLRRCLDGLVELGIATDPLRMAPPTSLNVPTGSKREIAIVRRPMAELSSIAHGVGGTINDVLIAVITGALLRVLRSRSECPKRIVVSVPVAGGPVDAPGNHSGVRPLSVPSVTNDAARLRYVVRQTRQQRATMRRASSAIPLGFAFRLLARVGLFGWFVDHQRLVHTFVSNLRGPQAVLSLGGSPIAHLAVMSVSPGNVGVAFTALSYAGELALTVVTDPAVCDAEQVARSVQEALAGLQPVT